MGKLKKFHERRGNGPGKSSVIIVPGLCASSLAEQTCCHFEKWIEENCGTSNTSMTIWIYHHGVELNTKKFWDYFCSAGGELINQILELYQSDLQSEDTALVLIGHRLGVFILKKALIEAHRRNHHPRERALFEAVQTLIMIGDPDLHEENQHEWTQLVQESLLSSKKLSPEICSEQALACLKSISDTFEEVTIQSRFFQVSGRPPMKQGLLKLTKSYSKPKGCICYANISVRMWSTADEDDILSGGDGDEKKCIFHPESKHRKNLLWMTSSHLEMQKALEYDIADVIPPMAEFPNRNLEPLSEAQAPIAIHTAVHENHKQLASSTDNFSTSGASEAGPITVVLDDNITQITRMADTLVDNNIFSISTCLLAETNSRHELLPFETVTTQSSIVEDVQSHMNYISPIELGKNDDYGSCMKNSCHIFNLGDSNTRTNRKFPVQKISNDDNDDQVRDSDRGENADATSTRSGYMETTARVCEPTPKMNNVGSDIRFEDVSDMPSSGLSPDNIEQTEPQMCAAEDPITTTPHRSRKLPLRLRLPLRPKHFIGREDIMHSLKNHFLSDQNNSTLPTIALQKQNVALIQGIAGIGKTAIALEFIHRYGDQFEQVFWIRGNNQLSIAQSVHEASIALGLIQGRSNHNHAESRAAFRSWLETTTSKWLLIFDDVDKMDVTDPYIPLCRGGSIIFTTCIENTLPLRQENMSIFLIPVLPFTERECFEFLSNCSSSGDLWTSEDAIDIGKLLHGHPTMLSLISNYVDCLDGSFSERWKNLRCLKSTLQLVSTDAELALDIKSRPEVYSLGLMTIETLFLNSLSPEAKALCCVVSFLDPHNIQDSILLGAQRHKAIPLEEFPLTDDQFISAKNEVISRSFCSVNEGRLSMHRLIQAGVRQSLMSQSLDAKVKAIHTAILLLLTQWPSKRKFKNILLGNWPEFDQLHSHVHYLSGLFTEDMSTEKVPLISALAKLLLRFTWYNSCIRGNAEEDVFLIELCHLLLTLPDQNAPTFTRENIEFKASMPQRLVEINDGNSSWKVIDTGDRDLPYMALSYVWGNQPDTAGTTKLTRSNLRRCQSPRSIDEMPRLFRDACHLTRRLGIRHIWIDNLCILQDDNDEKQREISVMDRTYHNAICTITASVNRSRKLSGSSSVVFDNDRQVDCESYSILDHKGSWRKRSWAVQENIVSTTNVIQKLLSSISINEEIVEEILSKKNVSHVENTPITLVNLNLEQWTALVRATKDNSDKDQPSNDREQFSTTESTVSTADVLEHQVITGDIDPKSNSFLVGVETPDPEPQDRRDQHLRSLELAKSIAQEGIQDYNANNALKAIAKIIKARDYTCAFVSPSMEGLQGYLLFSSYLALIYLSQGSSDMALDVLTDAERILEENISIADNLPSVIMGRFYMALGDSHLGLTNPCTAQTSYEKAATYLIHEDSDSVNLHSIVNLKISDIHVSRGNFEEAHTLLQSTISHFENIDTPGGQAQYARALHRQAQIFGAQGKERIRKSKYAAARQALIDFREEAGLDGELPEVLSKEDFETGLEFGFR